jgi:hypothetical protein
MEPTPVIRNVCAGTHHPFHQGCVARLLTGNGIFFYSNYIDIDSGGRPGYAVVNELNYWMRARGLSLLFGHSNCLGETYSYEVKIDMLPQQQQHGCTTTTCWLVGCN